MQYPNVNPSQNMVIDVRINIADVIAMVEKKSFFCGTNDQDSLDAERHVPYIAEKLNECRCFVTHCPAHPNISMLVNKDQAYSPHIKFVAPISDNMHDLIKAIEGYAIENRVEETLENVKTFSFHLSTGQYMQGIEKYFGEGGVVYYHERRKNQVLEKYEETVIRFLSNKNILMHCTQVSSQQHLIFVTVLENAQENVQDDLKVMEAMWDLSLDKIIFPRELPV